jgi:uncharacterized protein (TIGR00661 family)
MKILFAIQGTGNGHLARAEDVIPILKEYGDLDLFVSGAQADIKLSYPVKYTSKGLSFFFGKGGGVDFLKTFRKNSSKDVYREIRKFPVEKYDFVINDFEPISAWACQRKKVPCVSLSHQSSLLSKNVPHPRKSMDVVGEWLIHHYAPSHHQVGFHFERYDDFIFTPVIRSFIRNLSVKQKEHYTVYLPAYDDKKLVPLLSTFPNIQWHVFSKHTRMAYNVGRLSVYPVNNKMFVESLTSSKGVLCGAGFETPAESLFLGKKLMVIPMKAQLEQHYNAAALKKMGVPVLKKLKKKQLPKIEEWLNSSKVIHADYPDVTVDAVKLAVELGGKGIV